MTAGGSEVGVMSLAMQYLYNQIASGTTGAMHRLKYGSISFRVPYSRNLGLKDTG